MISKVLLRQIIYISASELTIFASAAAIASTFGLEAYIP